MLTLTPASLATVENVVYRFYPPNLKPCAPSASLLLVIDDA